MKFFKVGNSKKFIVFLHGWGADKNSFLWMKNYFQDYSLVFVDFPGFGESGEPDKPFFVADFSLCLKHILDGFEIEELVLVGHSFGGRVAIKFLKMFQNEFDKVKLCLIDSAGIKPKRSLAFYIKIFRYKRLKRKSKNRLDIQKKLLKFGSKDYKKLSSTMKQTFVNVVNEDLSKDAMCVRAQTIIIWGENDKDTKMFMAKKLNRLICDSKLFVLKDAGHFSFLDKPNEFLFILDSFVKNK